MIREFVEASQRGDQGAFMQLVRLRGDQMFAIAYRILRDVDRAKDALQDALVIVWRDLPNLRDPEKFDAWSRRLLTNVCIAQATRDRRRIGLINPVQASDPVASNDLLGVDVRDQLERGFRHLKPDERALLVLHHFNGYSPTEIAEQLGIPAGTVRSRLHHAHRAMRAALEADERPATAPGEIA